MSANTRTIVQLLQRHTPVIPPSYSALVLTSPSPPVGHALTSPPAELSAATSPKRQEYN